jgi:hypothetical protein
MRSGRPTVDVVTRPRSWKRRLTIRALLVLTGLIAFALTGLRTPIQTGGPVVGLMGLFVILTFSIWRYAPRRLERAYYLTMYAVYFGVIVWAGWRLGH